MRLIVGIIGAIIIGLTGVYLWGVMGVWHMFLESFVSLFPDTISAAMYLGYVIGIFTCVLCVPGFYFCYKMVQDIRNDKTKKVVAK